MGYPTDLRGINTNYDFGGVALSELVDIVLLLISYAKLFFTIFFTQS